MRWISILAVTAWATAGSAADRPDKLHQPTPPNDSKAIWTPLAPFDPDSLKVERHDPMSPQVRAQLPTLLPPDPKPYHTVPVEVNR
jgi:hypothetical protein